MSYQALLFCQDEKTARTVTQVLSELEFQVDACAETFGAVKKLTSQAFEAIVVDCANEENASLLLKTARNSASNQASLMVALVEGQAGVAAAFRIGANLVLTKPIAVEQARGTLRVARGLLRKNAGTPAAAVRPAAPVEGSPRPAVATSSIVAPSIAAPSITIPPITVPPVVRPEATRVPAAASAVAPSFGVSKPVAGGSLASRPVAASPASTSPASAGGVSASPVAPRPVTAAPAGRIPVPPSALRAVAASSNLESESEQQPQPDAASAGLFEAIDFKTFDPAPAQLFVPATPGIISVTELTSGAHEAVRAALTPRAPMSSQEFGAGFGAGAAAAAPARELAPIPAASAAMPAEVADLFEAPVFGQGTAAQHPGGALAETETYKAELDFSGSPAASRSKTPMVAVAAVLILATAVYFGWSQMRKPTVATTPTAGPLQPPPPDFGAADAANQAPAPATTRVAPDATADATQGPVATINRFSRGGSSANQNSANQNPATQNSVNQSVAEDRVTTPIAVVTAHAGSAAPGAVPLQVKTEVQRTAPLTAGQDATEAPSIANLGATQKPEALNAIARTPGTALPAAPASPRVSQGVVEGVLIKRVQPVYPQQALQMHAQGTVTLQATIAKDGAVSNVKVLSGPAALARAATDAVRQWKYRPYTLNGEPVEIQTQININFLPPR